MSVEILPIATQQCRNYTCTRSSEQIEVMKLKGYRGAMRNKHVYSTMTRSSRFHCPIGVINKPTTVELWISRVYRRLAVAKFSKSTMSVQNAENGVVWVVRRHSRSWVMPPFDTAHTTSYSTLIETMCLPFAVFTARCYASAVLAVVLCLSVPVTSRSSTKTAKLRITQTKPHDSLGTVVFWRQRSPRNSTGVAPYGGARCM